MTIVRQCLIAAFAILISMPFLVPLQAPGIIYAVIGGVSAWVATWLWARRKYGRGVRVRPTLRIN
jgi:hypothetical protein